MGSRLIMITSFFLLLGGFTLLKEQRRLEARMQTLEDQLGRQENNPRFQQTRAQIIKKQAEAVLSIRCKDSNSALDAKGKALTLYWNGTATKVAHNLILTAYHLLDPTATTKPEKIQRVAPIKCQLYSRGTKIGEYHSEKNQSQRIGQRDMIVAVVNMNDKGKHLASLAPSAKNEPVTVGQTLALVSHPQKFINDYLISFGQVLNENSDSLLSEGSRESWKNSIITSMTASEGSSGSPLFNLDGDFIGMHVGGEREKGISTNYQIVFDSDFQMKYFLGRILLSPHQIIRALGEPQPFESVIKAPTK